MMRNDSSPHVLILAGGLSHERDVSLRSGRRVAQVLKNLGLDVTVSDIDDTLLPLVNSQRPDLVWPLLHGATGEDGSVRDLLDLLNLPYVGSSAAGSRVAWSKPIAKSIIIAAGGYSPSFTTFHQSLFRDVGARGVLELVEQKFEFPLVIKPAHGGSALGVTVVEDAAELPQAMVSVFAYDDVVMIESHVRGTELAVSVVDVGEGPEVLPSVEIVTDGAYDYDARYNPGRSEYFVPSRLSEEQNSAGEQLALLVHNELGLNHFSRTDMIIDDTGKAQFLDTNVAPGMTETSLFPQAAQASRWGSEALYAALVNTAINHGHS